MAALSLALSWRLVYGARVPRWLLPFVTSMVLLPVVATAQDTRVLQPYRAVITAYRSGADLERSVAPLRTWTSKEFEQAVAELATSGSEDEIEAAAMLHLEFALKIAPVSQEAAWIQIGFGRKLLATFETIKPIRPRAPTTTFDPTPGFEAEWCGVAASLFLAMNDPEHAHPLLDHALTRTPKSARLLTMSGAAVELDLAAPDVDLWNAALLVPQAGARRRRLLDVERWYRDAIQADDTFVDAHLRLGRVLYLLGRYDEAQASAQRAHDLSKAPRQGYLAALTLAAIRERKRDRAGARTWYEAAEAIVPHSQTVTVALGRLDVLAGRPDLAQARTREFFAHQTNDAFWWDYKNGGLDEDSLAKLRAKVKQ